MKKALIIILVLLLILAGVAGGFFWYRNTHVFVDGQAYPNNKNPLDLHGEEIDPAHYDSICQALPGTDVLWDVPFQGGRVSCQVNSLVITELTEADIALTDYFTNLQVVDATGCKDYAALQQLQQRRPEVKIVYKVDLGGTEAACDAAELTLQNGEYRLETLMENLQYLPGMKTLAFPKTELTTEQIDGLKEAYPEITVTYTLELLGKEYDLETREMDLSAMTANDLAEAEAKLPLFTALEKVELMKADATSALSLEQVRQLKTAAPNVAFNYTFTMYEQTINTNDETVTFSKVNIGDSGLDDMRLLLDVMNNCSKLTLDNCKVTNEPTAKLREEYRDKTKVVWRVWFGKDGSCLTDREMVRAVYGLTDDNCAGLSYCEDIKYIDIGHNEYLDAVPFVANMKNLEAIIVSGAPIKDLTPFENCPNLKFLELSNCMYITDVTPLAKCTSLEMLNLSYSAVTDLTPLDELPLTHFTAVKSKLSQEEKDRFSEQHPDCWVVTAGDQPYGQGWRYDKEDKELEYYSFLRKTFKYDTPGNTQW